MTYVIGFVGWIALELCLGYDIRDPLLVQQKSYVVL